MKSNPNKYIGVFKKIFQSATFALLLSVAFFAYEMNSGAEESKKIVNDLMAIQNSLSTRYLGLFPEYIGNINNLLDNAIEHHDKVKDKDAVIICQDVLYYGIRSDVHGFRDMLTNLVTLSEKGCHISIAYYDEKSFPFKNMINNSLISTTQQKNYRSDRSKYRERLRLIKEEYNNISRGKTQAERVAVMESAINKHFDNYIVKKRAQSSKNNSFSELRNQLADERRVDSILCEQYFRVTNAENPNKIKKLVTELLRPIPLSGNNTSAYVKVDSLCKELDAIKQKHLNKPLDTVLYADVKNMYAEITIAIANMLNKLENVELVPLDEYLTMSCWMTIVNGKQTAIIAFPSKYSSDEIGFISQDTAFSKYIQTMLEGMKLSSLKE